MGSQMAMLEWNIVFLGLSEMYMCYTCLWVHIAKTFKNLLPINHLNQYALILIMEHH